MAEHYVTSAKLTLDSGYSLVVTVEGLAETAELKKLLDDWQRNIETEIREGTLPPKYDAQR